MSTRTRVIIDAINASSSSAKIAASAAASTAISFTPNPEGKLLLNNLGPNVAYVQVSNLSGVLAVVPGAVFALGAIPVAVGDKPTIDISKIKPDAAGLLWVSAICDATQTAALTAVSY